MGIQFHDGTKEIFQAYSGGQAWNNDNLLGVVPSYIAAHNTEEKITKILNSARTRKMGETGLTLGGLLDSADLNAWVVKGLHQVHGNLFAVTHITLGYDGYLWHVEVAFPKNGPYVVRVTQGNQATEIDADDFQIVTKKKKKGKKW